MTKKRKVSQSKFGAYYTIPFSGSRRIVEDYISVGNNTLKVYAIGDIDVTYPREKIKEFKEKGLNLSFTAFVLNCFVQLLYENPRIQAIKYRRKKMVIFEDIDVNFLVEREVNGVKVPTSVVIRKVQNKSIKELTDIIRGSKEIQDNTMVDKEKEGGAQTALLLRMPSWLRKRLFKFIFRNPFRRRQFVGTTGLTSIGMYTGGGGTSIPIAAHNISVNVGGIQVRPGYAIDENGELDKTEVVPREYLWMTFNVDHVTVDGGPIARFIAEFRERLRNGYGLDKIEL